MPVVVFRELSPARRGKPSRSAKAAPRAVAAGGFGRMLAKLSGASTRLETARRRAKR